MPGLLSLARSIRHAPGLESMDWLWNRLRSPYQFLLDPLSRGTAIMLGGTESVRIPARFSDQLWERYEPATVRRVAAWVRANPTGLLLDIGSSFGIYTTLATTISKQLRVVAFDSHLPSLKGVEMMCRSSGALTSVHGFISERHESGLSLTAARSRTSELLDAIQEPQAADIAYTCLDSANDALAIPTHSIDGLLDLPELEGRPVLFKCDIEGAELFALRGAERLLHDAAPTLCLSVHPSHLRSFGHCVEDVAAFLEKLNYSVEVLEVDWEEHWWCTPR